MLLSRGDPLRTWLVALPAERRKPQNRLTRSNAKVQQPPNRPTAQQPPNGSRCMTPSLPTNSISMPATAPGCHPGGPGAATKHLTIEVDEQGLKLLAAVRSMPQTRWRRLSAPPNASRALAMPQRLWQRTAIILIPWTAVNDLDGIVQEPNRIRGEAGYLRPCRGRPLHRLQGK